MLRSDSLPSIHDEVPILEFIRSRLDATGSLDGSAVLLPDEAPSTPGGVSWMAGALDGVMGHHAGSDGQQADRVEEIAKHIARAAAKPSRRRLRKLYDVVKTDDVLGLIDPVLEALVALRPSSAEITTIGTWLASTAPDRGPVKVGVALLGLTRAPNRTILHELGAHEEFTLYSAVALENSRPDSETDIFELAQRVDGWGRIHCVERLSSTTNPDIAQWILVEGFRNTVMYEYLAYIAATTGDLAGALERPVPSRDVLTAAAEIIGALLFGGPAEDIDSYEAAPAVLEHWLGHMDDRAETINDLSTIQSIKEFCDRDDWSNRLENGPWTCESRDAIRAHADVLFRDARWPDVVRRGLASSDGSEFHRSVVAARSLDLDPFDALLKRIDAEPLGSHWFQAWEGSDTDQANLLVERARRLLDIDSIATGPSNQTGMGLEFKTHMALGWTLQGIQQHPGVGPELLTAALQSPSVQNRNAALRALEAWGPTNWNSQHRTQLETLAASDPNDNVRERAVELQG